MPFFSPGPASDLYVRCRDGHADTHAYCETLWQRYEPFNGDRHFLSDAKENFHARTWEMILTCALLDQGMTLVRPPPNGPDIQIVPATGCPFWIEAVTVDLGTGGDHAGRVDYQKVGDNGSLFYTKPDQTALRYTSALDSKARQRQRFIDRGIVAPGDIFVVAINGGQLDDYTNDLPNPEILKSVYAVGDLCITYTVDDPNAPPTTQGLGYRDHVTKASGTEIRTDAFLTHAYSGVSALLYSRTTALNPQPLCRDYMLTVHNMKAAAGLPRGFFAFGREAVFERNQVCWTKHPQVVAH